MPKNPDAHQLNSLILFALKQYSQSAAAAHTALTGGPGWNWLTLKSFYPSAAAYTDQLRFLENVARQNELDPGLRFLLAYHYLMMGHTEAGIEQLVRVVALEPRDELSARLLKSFTGQNVPVPPQQPIVPGAPILPVAPVGPTQPQPPIVPGPQVPPTAPYGPTTPQQPIAPGPQVPPTAPYGPTTPQQPFAPGPQVPPAAPTNPNLPTPPQQSVGPAPGNGGLGALKAILEQASVK